MSKKSKLQKKSLPTIECTICHQRLPSATAGVVSHYRKHVRNGFAKETRGEDGKLKFLPTDKAYDPSQETVEKSRPIQWGSLFVQAKTVEPRRKTIAMLKKGQVQVACKKCGKFTSAAESLGDKRFYRIICCDALTMFPKRMESKLQENKQLAN